MNKCKEITLCAKELLRKHRIHVNDNHKKEVVELLSNYIDLLIFNIVAVISIICANIGVKKVITQHIHYLSKYIDKRCLNKKGVTKTATRMSGGSAFNTAAFFGVAEPRYSVLNEGMDVQNIDFASGIARNALSMNMSGGGGGGAGSNGSCFKLDKIILRKIKNVFKFFNMKVDKEAVAHIKTKYDTIIGDLYNCIKKIKGDITPLKVSQLIKKSKIMKKN